MDEQDSGRGNAQDRIRALAGEGTSWDPPLAGSFAQLREEQDEPIEPSDEST